MLTGILLLLAAGTTWVAVGVAVSHCSRNGANYNLVQGQTTVGTALLSLVVMTFLWGWPQVSGPAILLVLLCHFAAGAANYYAYVLTARAMAIGHNGMVWSLMQSGMSAAFLMGVIFFGVALTPARGVGLLLIVGGILLFGASKSGGHDGGRGWLAPALGAFALVGFTHCCNGIPSYWPEAAATGSVFRSFAGALGGIGAYLFSARTHRELRSIGTSREWKIAGTLIALGALSSYFLFFNGLNLVSEAGAGSIGSPIAVGTCIVGFTLYSAIVLREKMTPLRLLGSGATTLGIILISL